MTKVSEWTRIRNQRVGYSERIPNRKEEEEAKCLVIPIGTSNFPSLLEKYQREKKDRGLDDLMKRVLFFHSLLDVVKLD